MPRGVKKAGVVAQQLQEEMTAGQIPTRPAGDTIKTGTDEQPPVAAKAAPPKPPAKKKPQRVETILVRHDFTAEEQLALGQSLADKQRVANDIAAEAKACARQYKDKLATVETEIGKTVDEIKDGFNMVSVECVVLAKIDRKEKTVKKVFYRKDTGAFIKDENALNVELELFNILPDKRDHKKALDEKLLNQV